MLELLCPEYRFHRLTSITPEWLEQEAVDRMILDVDNTFLAKGSTEPDPEHLAWLEGIRRAGIQVALVTNNGGERIHALSEKTGVPATVWAAKPSPLAFWRACCKMKDFYGAPERRPRERTLKGKARRMAAKLTGSARGRKLYPYSRKRSTLVVGDQLFTDVLGAHLYGFRAAWIKPLPGKDFIVTSFMRCWEDVVVRQLQEAGRLPAPLDGPETLTEEGPEA